MIALVIAATSTSVEAGGLYKWTDPVSGAAVYSNDPPPASVRSVEQKRIAPSTIETSSLPYGVQQATKRNPIILYATDCGEFCNAARAYLAKRGLPYTERNPQQPTEAEQLRKASNGVLEVPYLVVGTRSVRGFDEARYASALDSAGYPKSSLGSLGVKPPLPKASTYTATEAKPGDSGAAMSEGNSPAKQAVEAGRTLYQQSLASNSNPI
jgi:glutaredoxin